MEALTGDAPPPATAALRASLAAELTAVLGRPPSDAVCDAGVQLVDVGGDDRVVLRPRDWRALREADAAAGRPAPYWALPWPSGTELARVVARERLAGRRVLELGCGLALPSIAAARSGAHVLAVDVSAEAAVYAAHNLAVNEVAGETAAADWRDTDVLARRGPWDLVLAADVLYLRENVESLLRVLPRLMSDTGEAWLADPGRAGAKEFLPVARRLWRLRSESCAEDVTVHKLSARGADPR